MSKQIKISYNNKEYTLEYSRDSSVKMEALGFSVNELSEKIATNYPLLFRGAFFKNHALIKQSEVDEVYSQIKDTKKLYETLIGMVTDCYLSLMGEEEEGEEKNATWEIVE